MFWSNFKKLCAEKGEAANVVAAKCGVKSTGTVTGWKNGAMPSPKTLSKIADYFGVTVEALTEEQENKPALPQENELDNELIELLTELRPDEVQLLVAYAQGIIAARKNS